ncbi:MAG: DNA-binding protein [Candidatus Helarchaeota archaeon]
MDELEKIKRKKLLELQRRLIKQKKMEEEKKKLEELEALSPKDPRERLIKMWMTPEAYQYLAQIRNRDKRVSNLIEEVIIYLVNKGLLKNRLTYQQIIIIERKIIGRGPTIKIKRAGKEIKDFADELKSKI